MRRVLVNAVLVGVLFGAAFEVVTGGEHWPFSSYPMFSRVRQEARVDHLAFVAVPADGSPAFALYEHEQIHPYRWYRQRQAFKRLLDGSGGEPSVRVGLADLLRRYELGRREGRHGGPPLEAIRLYRVDYDIDPGAPDLLVREDRRFVTEVTPAGVAPTRPEAGR
jgi:hypothetical protein